MSLERWRSHGGLTVAPVELAVESIRQREGARKARFIVSSLSKTSEGALVAGQMLGRYELLSPIATGGMGNVWAARLKGTRGFRKLVAIKTVLHPKEDPRLEHMLFQEATLASQIQHPNVVETIELGEHEGLLYLVMDLVEGESLSFILRKALPSGGVPLQVAVNLIGQVCRGLQAAHELTDGHGDCVGLVHRDISPPNVLVTYSGTVKIVDFGVATTALSGNGASGEIKGKISYLAPEQLRAESLDARVDVFAVGILLYLLTANRHPFRSSLESDTIQRILSDAPVMPPSAFVEDYPDALEAVLLRALAKKREQRFESAAALLDALEGAVPSAFGPAADKAVVEYVQALLRDRMLERRHILRAAEDLSESSSPRASVLSVPAVAASRHPPANSSRRRVASLGALLLTLGGAVLAAQTYLSTPPSKVTRAASAALAMQEGPAPAAPSASPMEKAAPLERGPASPSLSAVRSVDGVPAKNLARKRAARSDSQEESAIPEAAPIEVEATEVLPEPEAPAALAVSSGLLPASGLDGAVASPARAPQARETEESPRQTRVRQVASKLGHERLAVNPTAEAYRARLPVALQRTGQNFDATLNICIAANGAVSGVKLLKSAGPMIDRHLAAAVRLWRYRPLLEGGRAVAFCYVLRYEFAGR